MPAAPDEPKIRGANRSTKVTGKLKVLPEQPEPEPVPAKRELLRPPRTSKDQEEGTATTGESDEDENETEETEDVDVRPARRAPWRRTVLTLVPA